LLARYLKKRLWESRQIYNLDAHWNGDELRTFWGQEVKVQGHSKTIMVI